MLHVTQEGYGGRIHHGKDVALEDRKHIISSRTSSITLAAGASLTDTLYRKTVKTNSRNNVDFHGLGGGGH